MTTQETDNLRMATQELSAIESQLYKNNQIFLGEEIQRIKNDLFDIIIVNVDANDAAEKDNLFDHEWKKPLGEL